MPPVKIVTHGPITEFVFEATLFKQHVMPLRAYFVDGLLIDTGSPRLSSLFESLLKEYPITQVVNTHHHEDHAGNNALVNQLLGITPYAHALAMPLLTTPARIPFYRQAVWGAAAASSVQPIGETIETPRYRFLVLHTPGHSPDHIVLLEPNEGWLFAGDLFLAERHKMVRRVEDPNHWMDSLSLTLKHDFKGLFCAHRGRVEDGYGALSRKLSHMTELRASVRDLHEEGLSARAIALKLLGKDDLMTWLSLGDFSRVNLVKAFLPGWTGPLSEI
jgi:ribonuclease/clavin/mitogillin